MAPEPKQIKFSEQDYATARVVWSIIATEASDCEAAIIASINHPSGGGVDPRSVASEMRKALLAPPEDDTIAYVRSIIVKALQLKADIPKLKADIPNSRLIYLQTTSMLLYNQL
jgi:hypothetical protein